MRRVRDVTRMMAAGMPSRVIARRVGPAPSTVRLTIRRFEAAGLTWPLPDDVTDIYRKLGCTPAPGAAPGRGIGGKPSRTGQRCTASSSAST